MKNNRFLSNLQYDLPSSVIVFFVATPLCLGIALASGAPLFSGIIAGFVGGIIVGAISDSQLGVSGPAAGLAVIVLETIQELGAFEIFLVAVVLGGVFQLVLGILKGGIIGYYFPSSVIKGMLAGIGIIIFIKQLRLALGIEGEYTGSFWNAISIGSLITSVGALLIILFWDIYLAKKGRFFKIIQGPLVAVIFGIAYHLITMNYFPEYAIRKSQLVNVPLSPNVDAFIANFTFPDFSQIMNSSVWIAGFTFAIVASLETLLCVEATDKLDPEKRFTNSNRELLAQGTGSIISGLLGGLPITQVIVRSSTNIQSGAKSKMSAIFHGFLILICVALIPQTLNLIPLSVLASILMVVGFKLAKPALFIQQYKDGLSQFIPFIITIAGIVFADLLIGVSLGLAIGILMVLRNNYKNSHFLHEKVDENDEKHITFTLSEEVTFINKATISQTLSQIPDGARLTINQSNSVTIDYDVQEIIKEFIESAESRNIQVEVIN